MLEFLVAVTALALDLRVAAPPPAQERDSIAATLERQLDHVAVTELLRDCRVDEALERIERSAEHPESEGYRLQWAAGLRVCGAEESANALLAELASEATSPHTRVEARARLAEEPALRGDFEEALRRLRAIDAQVPTVALRIGWLEVRRRRVEEALEIWRSAEREHASWALRLAIVETLDELGRADEALAAWRRPGERWHGLLLDSTADEDLMEARLLLAAGAPSEARERLEPYLRNPLDGLWEVWVESLHAEVRLEDPNAALANVADPTRARVVRALFELHLRADREGLWSAALGRGPLASEHAYAAKLFMRTPGASEHARAQLANADDLHALAFLARLGDGSVLGELAPRLAAARNGLRGDGEPLLYVLTLLGTPEAYAALWRWSADPALGDCARRIALHYSPCGSRRRGRLESPLD